MPLSRSSSRAGAPELPPGSVDGMREADAAQEELAALFDRGAEPSSPPTRESPSSAPREAPAVAGSPGAYHVMLRLPQTLPPSLVLATLGVLAVGLLFLWLHVRATGSRIEIAQGSLARSARPPGPAARADSPPAPPAPAAPAGAAAAPFDVPPPLSPELAGLAEELRAAPAWAARARAARRIGELRALPLAPALEEALQEDPDWAVRALAADALAVLSVGRQALARASRADSERAVREAASAALEIVETDAQQR